jgi:hypothetical protein
MLILFSTIYLALTLALFASTIYTCINKQIELNIKLVLFTLSVCFIWPILLAQIVFEDGEKNGRSIKKNRP